MRISSGMILLLVIPLLIGVLQVSALGTVVRFLLIFSLIIDFGMLEGFGRF